MPPDPGLTQGFTLIELLLTMALSALLAVLAFDALPAWRARQRLEHTGRQLVAQLHYARAEALRGNRPVYVCALNAKSNFDLQGCLNSRRRNQYVWDEGALLYADNPLAAGNRPAVYDSGERLRALQFEAPLAVSAPLGQLRFDADGRPAAALAFRLETAAQCRTVRLSSAGRARLCRPGEVGCDGC